MLNCASHKQPLLHSHHAPKHPSKHARWRRSEGACWVFTIFLLMLVLLLWAASSPWVFGGDESHALLQQLERGQLPFHHHQPHHSAAAAAASSRGAAWAPGAAVSALMAAAEVPLPPAGATASSSSGSSSSGPPYILPKLIHQTVKDKDNMPCQVRASIQTWIDMNPGYEHRLYDDADLLQFVTTHYPELVDMFASLPTNIERTDTWRYLVLHKHGGVYADADVQCMQSIDTWNEQHGHDAALMVGIAKRNLKTGEVFEFNQFVMASMPGHPVMGQMPLIIAANLALTFLQDGGIPARGAKHDAGILARTGPKAFTSSLRLYAAKAGAAWPVNSTRADAQGGVLFGDVRALPKFVLGAGWDTIDHNMTCAEVKRLIRPEALICHQFFGSWKAAPEAGLKNIQLTYGGCGGAEAGGEAAAAAAAEAAAERAAEEAEEAAASEPGGTLQPAQASHAQPRDGQPQQGEDGQPPQLGSALPREHRRRLRRHHFPRSRSQRHAASSGSGDVLSLQGSGSYEPRAAVTGGYEGAAADTSSGGSYGPAVGAAGLGEAAAPGAEQRLQQLGRSLQEGQALPEAGDSQAEAQQQPEPAQAFTGGEAGGPAGTVGEGEGGAGGEAGSQGEAGSEREGAEQPAAGAGGEAERDAGEPQHAWGLQAAAEAQAQEPAAGPPGAAAAGSSYGGEPVAGYRPLGRRHRRRHSHRAWRHSSPAPSSGDAQAGTL